jgi:hypothetical protein
VATRIQFEEWLPDQPSITSLRDAKNVYPTGVGYAPFNNQETFSQSVADRFNSIFGAKIGDEVGIFAGSDTKLYKLDSTDKSLDDVSKAGNYTGTTWKFVQFGATVICANNQDKLQSWTLGTSTQFADLNANAPTAKYVTVVRDFVVAANLDAGTNTNKVQWSDINDETTWVSGTTSQSDYQIIPDGGNITGLTGGEIGLIFLEKSIVRMTYAGSPLFFQFDTISRGLGCLEGNSIAQYGATSFFLSDDGFYKCDGQTVTGIGTEKVDRYFFNDAELEDIQSMSAAVDPIKKLVVWNYKNVQGKRSILIYNWQLNKWSRAETLASGVGTITSTGVSLEGLDTLGYTDMDNADFPSLDSRLWVGGKFLFAGFKNNSEDESPAEGYIVIFEGSTYNSELITPDIELGYNSVVTLARPQVDNGTATVKVASRRELDDNIQFGSSVTTSSEGRVSLRSAGRYHRFLIIPTGNWTNAIGLDVDVKPQGNR